MNVTLLVLPVQRFSKHKFYSNQHVVGERKQCRRHIFLVDWHSPLLLIPIWSRFQPSPDHPVQEAYTQNRQPSLVVGKKRVRHQTLEDHLRSISQSSNDLFPSTSKISGCPQHFGNQGSTEPSYQTEVVERNAAGWEVANKNFLPSSHLLPVNPCWHFTVCVNKVLHIQIRAFLSIVKDLV